MVDPLPRSHGRHLLAAALLVCPLAAGCGAAPPQDVARPESAAAPSIGARGERIDIPMGPEYREIALLEDARTLGRNGHLLTFLAADDPAVRARAVRALGRMPYPEIGSVVTDALVRALTDPDPGVRIEAAFALGVRGDASAARSLLPYCQDSDPGLRARVVEAASRLADPGVHAELLAALRDEDIGVRIEAADGASGWSRDEPGAEAVDRALLDALAPGSADGRPSSPDAVAPELRWHLVHALARRRARLGRGAFLDRLTSPEPLDRLFAAMGLGRMEHQPDAPKGDADATAALVHLVLGEEGRAPEPDSRVVVEAARALGSLGDAEALPALAKAAGSPDASVRAVAMEAVGKLRASDSDVLPVLRRGRLDLSPTVRGAAVAAMVARVHPADAVPLLREAAGADDPIERAAAAAAAGDVDSPDATTLLVALAADPSPYVATRAVEAFGAQPPARARALLHGYLTSSDNGIRLAAVTALAEMPDASDVAPLAQAFRSSTGDVSAEIAASALHAVATVGGDEARTLLRTGCGDPRPWVRHVAATELRERFGEETPPPSQAGDPTDPDEPDQDLVPLPGRDYPRWTHDPLVEVVTTRGRMVFELLPAEAPIHVVNFLALAKAGAYDGLTFHRVVPDFVVQGGDYRGDGNGARPWRGEALRAEFTPRAYRRGALGMPRNEDPDSGGSQFFVTHRPTPHLDGRYTQFGLLREGGDVLDALEVGDRILRVRLLE